METRSSSIFLLNFIVIFQIFLTSYAGHQLPSFGPLGSNHFTVSGFSSGGAKALQLYLSHSSRIKGVGIMSGVMYRCEAVKLFEAKKLLQCSLATYDFNTVQKKIWGEFESGLLDPPESVASGFQYIHHGKSDLVVLKTNGDDIAKFLSSLSPNVFYNSSLSAHGFPTSNCGQSCSSNIPPLPRTSCRTCGWNAAFEMMNHVRGNSLRYPELGDKGTCRSGTLFEENEVPDYEGNKGLLLPFWQHEFLPKGTELAANMHRVGYVYVPRWCKAEPNKCTLHVHFHGCGHAAILPFVNEDDMRCTGLLEIADANGIIILFPQAKIGLFSLSGLGTCWDFVGYSGSDYGNKKGPQIQAVMGMANRILGG